MQSRAWMLLELKMKTRPEFEKHIQEIDPGFTIVDNPNRPGLANIYYNGNNYDLPVISSVDIPDEIDQNKRYEFPNGFQARLWSVGEVTDRLKRFVEEFNSIKEMYE